ALVDWAKLKRDFTVLCHVRLVQHTKDNVLEFEGEVLKVEEVSECYHVGGGYDYILKIDMADMTADRKLVVTKLTAIGTIGNTQSSFVIKEVKNSPTLHIGA